MNGHHFAWLLPSGHEEEARSLLDWKRDEVHKGGGDDPLAGVMLPRFWTSGETKGSDAIEVAAASLLVGKPENQGLAAEDREGPNGGNDRCGERGPRSSAGVGYAWLQLFDGTVNADGVQAAQQANMLSKNERYSEIHTLACLYAAEGKTTEARQLLLQAMGSSQLAEPNSAIWYGFGSIYEQYGVEDAAIAAYSQVEKPEGRMDPVDTYVLAEARLKALQGK